MRFAASGYTGGGRETAVPLSSPPDTGLRIGFGPGLGGGSESRITLIASFALTAATFISAGPPGASFVAVVEADGRSGALVTFLLFFAFAGVFTAGLVAGGVTGCGVVAAPGVTIRTMFSSR